MARLNLLLKRKLERLCFAILCFGLLLFFGVFHHLFEKNFFLEFHYPYDGDIDNFIMQLKSNKTPDMLPINSYNFYYYKSCDSKCEDLTDLRLVYIVKSAAENFERRLAIRSSWGFQKRFSDVEIRTVFLIGCRDSTCNQLSINEESQRFNDIIQANYTDSYFNNTFKTMSAFHWVLKYCQNAKFYMFIDDDYYVSTKNVLRFLRFPTNYPDYLKQPMETINEVQGQRRPLQNIEFNLEDEVRLYAGYAFQSSPHRHYISKWYVSLEEYPYHMWPPYISGGAYILSNAALKDMHYTSFYTKHFRFDDIYIGILAYKSRIEAFHSEHFHFYQKIYNKYDFKYVIASHGYGNCKEMVTIWNDQKSLGNA